jgi:hypothetical protein
VALAGGVLLILTTWHCNPIAVVSPVLASRRRLPSRPIATRHLVLGLSLSKLLSSFIAEPGHLSILATQALRVMGGPADMSFVEDIRPLRVVFLLFAFGSHCVHEVLLVGEKRLGSAELSFDYSRFTCSSRRRRDLAKRRSGYRYHVNKTYPSRFESLESELSFQPFAIVPQFPPSGVYQCGGLFRKLFGVFAARGRDVAG